MWLVADILHHNGHCFCDFCMCQFTHRQAYCGERVAVGEKAASERVFLISLHARVVAILQSHVDLRPWAGCVYIAQVT